MHAFVNNKGMLELHVDDYDKCCNCKNIKFCPLIQAITKEYVVLHYSNIEVKECGVYKKG